MTQYMIYKGFNSPSPLPSALSPAFPLLLILRGGSGKAEGGVPPYERAGDQIEREPELQDIDISRK